MGSKAELLAKNTELESTVTSLQDSLNSANVKIAMLDSHVRLLLSKYYGKSSEKITTEQLGLFGDIPDDEPVREKQVIPEHTRTKKPKKNGREAFPDHLPRKDFHSRLSGDDLSCPHCEATMKHIGEDVCERGHLIPARFIVNRYHKHKYACPHGHGVKTAEAPRGPFPRCKYESSVHADIVVARFADHMPYYRQASAFKRLGIFIPRSSMGDMAKKVAHLTKAILSQMRLELMKEPVINADETSITVLNEGQKGTTKGWMWVYCSPNKVLFDFAMTRGPTSPRRILETFFGILQVDGCPSYNEMVMNNQLIRAGCMAHVRRKFYDSFDSSGNGKEVIFHIARLYRIEAALKNHRVELDLSDEEFIALRMTIRQRFSRRSMNRIKKLVLEHEADPKVLSSSLLGKAIIYAMNQWPTLEVFLEHGEVEIDNNLAERTIRPVAVGRKNWMSLGNEQGGKTAATLYSLIESCKAIDVNPRAYLEDVIIKASSTSEDQMHTLTPWAWKASLAQD
jgi:transposase